jgi:hypothetical protein
MWGQKVRLNSWCMYAVVGSRDRVKNFLKKVNNTVLRYDIVGAQSVNVMFMRCENALRSDTQ